MVTATNETTTESSAPGRPALTTDVVAAPDVPASASARVSDAEAARGARDAPSDGIGGEYQVWEARYSPWNFLVRSIAAALLTAIWAVLAFDVWALERSDYRFLATLLGFATLAFWAYLGFRMLRAYQSHHYRLTTRRLFVSSGFFRRRVDQIELIRIKDLYVQQTMINHWLDVGTVVVVSSEQTLPRAALVGINRPQLVMDLIWQHTRREQDRKTTTIEQV